ncbi:MAG: glycosyltransferase family 9 protein [Pseudobdellovibrionaceae bacterium]
MSWPVARAVHRKWQESGDSPTIDFLCRPKFAQALADLEVLHQVKYLPSPQVLSYFLDGVSTESVQMAKNEMNAFLKQLSDEKYDIVYNLTYSPLSSYISFILEKNGTQVFGYSRFADDTLKITDNMSGYFYAQVGVKKSNRFHLTDIFSAVAEVVYQSEDWSIKSTKPVHLPSKYIVVHIGTSEVQKALPAYAWAEILNAYFKNSDSALPIVLVGSNEEVGKCKEIINDCYETSKIIDLVGNTVLQDLVNTVCHAQLLVGCDSAPMHIASLSNTPSLCISIGQVNFWETGPKADESWILRYEQEKEIIPHTISLWMHQVLEKKIALEGIVRSSGMESYKCPWGLSSDADWLWIKALYLGEAWPVIDDYKVYQNLEKFQQVNSIILQALKQSEKNLKIEKSILETAENLLESIGQSKDFVRPLFYWYQAEKVKVAPGTAEELIANYLNVHSRLQQILSHYILEETTKEGSNYGKI